MAATIDASVGGANSNSYELVSEADEYFETRPPLSPISWGQTVSKEANLIHATRTLEAQFSGAKRLVPCSNGESYYVTGRKWTGAPATTTQKLSWPRTGMFDRNGNPIPSDVIPIELKEAESEFAGQMNNGDTTLNNAAQQAGLVSLRAGSVSLGWKDSIVSQVVPDAVLALLPASWYTYETTDSANLYPVLFDVVSEV